MNPVQALHARAVTTMVIPDDVVERALKEFHPNDKRRNVAVAAFKEFLTISTVLSNKDRNNFFHGNPFVDAIWKEFSTTAEYIQWADAAFGSKGYPYNSNFFTVSDKAEIVVLYQKNFDLIRRALHLKDSKDIGYLYEHSTASALVRKMVRKPRTFRIETRAQHKAYRMLLERNAKERALELKVREVFSTGAKTSAVHGRTPADREYRYEFGNGDLLKEVLTNPNY